MSQHTINVNLTLPTIKIPEAVKRKTKPARKALGKRLHRVATRIIGDQS